MASLLSPELPATCKWLLVWALGPLGDCACLQRFNCPNSGKHPWRRGYEHGALSAGERPVDFPANLRLAVVPGPDVIVLDLDSERAWWSMVRYLSGEIQPDEVLGVAKTPRGWHVYLRSNSAWEQREVRAYMTRWFPWWQRSGIDLKVGSRGYVVYPSGDRYWVPVEHWAERLVQDYRDDVAVDLRGRADDNLGSVSVSGAASQQDNILLPWQLPDHAASEWQHAWRSKYRPSSDAGGTRIVIPKDRAIAALNHKCKILSEMQEGRRNNFLNQIAFYEGATAVKAGADPARVREELLNAGLAAGLLVGECRSTIRSGLTAGGVAV